MNKSFNKAIKERTTNEIYDAIHELLAADDPDLLTVTNISKRSGYSIGNIYHYFNNVDSLINDFAINRFKKKVNSFARQMSEQPTSATAKEIISSIVEENFRHIINELPRKMLIKLASKVMNDTLLINEIDEISLSLAGPIEAMINSNETNTFMKLTHAEIEMSVLMVTSAIRKPIITNHKLALSESHKQQVLAFLMAVFVQQD
jgi:AcrR family transcriptional regulator